EALLILFSKSTRPDFELKGSFKNYLHGICKNLWLRDLKKIAQKMGYTEKYIKQKNYKCKHHLASMIESDPRYKELIK
ncbi:MAG: hypothetical protein D6714_02645, partial [Bacteroidetes bacterium]